ncbi:MAG: PAS domain-containing protein [Candidatus Vogelbacteria bacterium]|nr:PAS domain-containing protein [Candidatus Vogelbacteria bacterium]
MALSKDYLKEFRCFCGKLLFKGLLLSSVIEIKCTRCGVLKSIKSINENSHRPNCFTILFDNKGVILNVSDSASKIIGYNPEEFLHLSIRDVSPGVGLSFYKSLWLTQGHNDTLARSKKVMYRNKSGIFAVAAHQITILENSRLPYFLVQFQLQHNKF